MNYSRSQKYFMVGTFFRKSCSWRCYCFSASGPFLSVNKSGQVLRSQHHNSKNFHIKKDKNLYLSDNWIYQNLLGWGTSEIFSRAFRWLPKFPGQPKPAKPAGHNMSYWHYQQTAWTFSCVWNSANVQSFELCGYFEKLCQILVTNHSLRVGFWSQWPWQDTVTIWGKWFWKVTLNQNVELGLKLDRFQFIDWKMVVK